MKEHGIIFSAPMVKALLDGSKTQTRRVLKSRWFEIVHEYGHDRYNEYDPLKWGGGDDGNGRHHSGTGPFDPKSESSQEHAVSFCPHGVAGDRLWVRETHYRYGRWLKNGLTKTGRQKWKFKPLDIANVRYLDDPPPELAVRGWGGWHKRPSIFMPRNLSRITLELTEVRVERLQDISEADAKAEGVQLTSLAVNRRFHYAELWDSLHGKGAWELNPWVWVLEFKRLCRRT